MAATIKIKNSSTASAVPTSSDLVQGELAVNVTDKRIFTENASGTVVELGTNPSILTLPDGSASAPTLTNDGDTNTGLFFPAADTVGITTGGTERARVDSSGNLGLGVTPSAWGSDWKAVQVGARSFYGQNGGTSTRMGYNWYQNSGGTNTYIGSDYATGYLMDSAHKWLIAGSGTAGGTVSFTQAMTLDASGNLGVGTTSPSGVLEAVGTSYFTRGGKSLILNPNYALTNTITQLQVGTGMALTFATNGDNERARIDSSGNLLLGKTAADQGTVGFQVRTSDWAVANGIASSSNAQTTYHAYSTTAAAYRFYVGMAGTVYATNTTISSLSDQRHKENIRDLNVGLTEIMALKPRLFDWKEGKGADIKNARGFIAQEFEQVFPDLIDEWKDPAPEGEEPYKSVRAELIPVLVKAIQEQQAIIQQLQADVAALKGQA